MAEFALPASHARRFPVGKTYASSRLRGGLYVVLMARPIRLWSGHRPTGAELNERNGRQLRIVRPEGYRLVRDRDGHQVCLELDRVRDHVGMSGDRRRWRLIPLIIPTIKRGERTQSSRGFQYQVTLTVAHHRGGHERVSFVVCAHRRGGHEIFDRLADAAAQVERQRKRAAGLPIRPNSQRTYVRPWRARSQRRPALRLPGAAAALEQEDSTVWIT